jgi:hypothetical protein
MPDTRKGVVGNIIDLDAARAARDEAAPFPVRFGGKDFEVPSQRRWKLSAMTALAAGDLIGFLQGIMPAAAYTAFMAAEPDVGDLETFVAHLTERAGVGDVGKP